MTWYEYIESTPNIASKAARLRRFVRTHPDLKNDPAFQRLASQPDNALVFGYEMNAARKP